jgi:hypothetical protein
MITLNGWSVHPVSLGCILRVLQIHLAHQMIKVLKGIPVPTVDFHIKTKAILTFFYFTLTYYSEVGGCILGVRL